MYNTIREKITRDFLELKIWTSDIGDESPVHINASSVSSRGLFFVYIYGIYEEVVRQIVLATIEEFNNAQITIDQCSFPMYSLVLSRQYDSMFNVGNEHKWEKRWAISDQFAENAVVSIPSELMPTDGKNLKIRQLNSIAKSFGVDRPVLPSPEVGHFIDEMVENRNRIAHGNVLPKEVGRSYTKKDLLIRIDRISEICLYMLETYEKFSFEHRYLLRQNKTE